MPSPIRPALADELDTLRAIERDAGRAFAAIGMEEIARDEPPPVAALEAFRAAGRAWVATDGAVPARRLPAELGRRRR